jgi:NitT/TauT family transport system substrate-binding protein
MSMGMRKVIAIGALCITAFSACERPSVDTPAKSDQTRLDSDTARDSIPVRIAVFSSGIQAPLFVVAKSKGFLEAEGIIPEFREFPLLPAVTQAFAAREADLIWIGVGQAAEMKNQGVPLRIILTHANAAEKLVVPVGSSDTSIANLKGKRIGTPGEGTTADVLFRLVARRRYGLDSRQDFTFVRGGEQQLLALLETGRVDAAILKVESAAAVGQERGRVLAALADEWRNIPGNTEPFILLSSTVRQELLDAHPDFAERYRRAMDAAYRYSTAHLDEVADLMSSQLGMRREDVMAYLSDWSRIYFSDLSPARQEALRRQWAAMVEDGELSALPQNIFLPTAVP